MEFPASRRKGAKQMGGVLVGFGPWILYWVLVSNNTFKEAAVAGLVASAVLQVWNLSHGSTPKILEMGTLVWFAVLTIGAFSADEKFFADWSYALSNGALATIVLVSILIGHPFARQYARETVPKEYWGNPMFNHSTLVISWAWFGAMVVMTASAALTRAYPEEELWFNWIIPFAALGAALKFTHWYPDFVKNQQQQPAVPGLAT
jgi:intracellular septation protein A